MIITKKIWVTIHEADSQLRRLYLRKIYQWRDLTRKSANLIMTHRYIQENIREFTYLTDQTHQKIRTRDLLQNGPGNSEQNITYRLITQMCKGIMPSEIYALVNQKVAKLYFQKSQKLSSGEISLPSFRNLNIPFPGHSLKNLHKDSNDAYYCTLYGIPLRFRLGRDRSNNRSFLQQILDNEITLKPSYLQVDDKAKRLYLLLSFDIETQILPKEKENKVLYAQLSEYHPIALSIDNIHYTIGSLAEFNYRREQIQHSCLRLRESLKYTNGYKGRTTKRQRIKAFQEKEHNYIETRLHQYSRMLINHAVQNHCTHIVLQSPDPSTQTVLPSWSFMGLQNKIGYKAELLGITVSINLLHN